MYKDTTKCCNVNVTDQSVVGLTQMYNFAQTHQNEHLKCEDATIYKLHFSKGDKKKSLQLPSIKSHGNLTISLLNKTPF